MTDDEETQRIRRPEVDETTPMPRSGEPDLFRARVEPEPEDRPWWDPTSEAPDRADRSWDEGPTEVVRSWDPPVQPAPPTGAGPGAPRRRGFRFRRHAPEPEGPAEPWPEETHQMPPVPADTEPAAAEAWADATHQMPAVPAEPQPDAAAAPWADQTHQMEPVPADTEPAPAEPWADETQRMAPVEPWVDQAPSAVPEPSAPVDLWADQTQRMAPAPAEAQPATPAEPWTAWPAEPQSAPDPEPVAQALPVPFEAPSRSRGRRARAEPEEVDDYHSGGGQSSRDEILTRVRTAIGGRPEPDETIVRRYRRDLGLPPDALVDLFAERVADYQARVRRVPRAEVAAAIAVCLVERGIRAIAVPSDVPMSWLPQYVDSLVDDGRVGPGDLDRVDGALTGCALGIAVTGTIVLDGGRRQGRRMLSLVPDYHLCVVNAYDVVGTVPEAMERLDPVRPVTFVSGPSATSDIELERIEGVHGPRRLDVLIAE